MENKGKKPLSFFNTISFKVLSIILIVLSIGIGITITYYLNSQNSTIIESREKAIQEEGEILYLAIKNNMLAGEAPIAVELFHSIRKSDFVDNIQLFRSNGKIAFSDNSTLNTVNGNLGRQMFTPKTSFIIADDETDENFKKSVSSINDVFVRNVSGDNKRLIIYKPLVNQPKCSKCHGLDHVIRGIIKVSSSVNQIYSTTTMNTIISAVIYGTVVAMLTILILIFIKRILIRRILHIGDVVKGVGQGDFKTKLDFAGTDEISYLGFQINDMIDGLNERFKLSKFVSRSTLEHVKSDDDLILGGDKRAMTVLFSDIRGFTSYSESRDPEEVIKTLNDVMNLQSEIINEFEGDIDKFVGDEIMAVFEGENMAERAVRAAIKIRDNLKDLYADKNDKIHVGIGINTGEMISGNMGSGRRMDRTVIGDAVNLGARLCSLAGKNVIVISSFCYDYVRDIVEVKEHDPIQVKGKSAPVKIYTVRNVK